MKQNKEENSQPNSPYNFFYIWNYLEWGGAQILFFGLMKEAQKIGKVKAVMPEGSNEQLLKFLDNINVPYNFFDAHLNTTPAIGISGKIKRHLNKIFCEFKLLTYLKRKGWKLLIDPRARVFCQPNTVPKKIATMTLREKADALFLNLGHIQNLRRRYYTYIDGAPTKFHGIVGFSVFFIRLGWQKISGKTKLQKGREKDIATLFAKSVVKD